MKNNSIGACLFALASVYSPNMDYKDNNKNYMQYNIKTIDEDLDYDSFDIDEVCYELLSTSWCIVGFPSNNLEGKIKN